MEQFDYLNPWYVEPKYWVPFYSYTTSSGERVFVERLHGGGTGDVRTVQINPKEGE